MVNKNRNNIWFLLKNTHRFHDNEIRWENTKPEKTDCMPKDNLYYNIQKGFAKGFSPFSHRSKNHGKNQSEKRTRHHRENTPISIPRLQLVRILGKKNKQHPDILCAVRLFKLGKTW